MAELDLTIQPAVVEITVQPGRTVTNAWEISNNGTQDLEVTLTLRDFIADGQTGFPVVLWDHPSQFPYAKLQNSDRQLDTPFLLPAGQSQQIVLGASIPTDALTRDWYVTLLAQTKPATGTSVASNTPPQTSQVASTGSVAANILWRISQNDQEPRAWQLELGPLPRMIDSLQSIDIIPTVSNLSASVAAPDMTILIKDWRGQIVYEENALPDRILARSTRVVTAGEPSTDDPRSFSPAPFRFDPLFAIGRYTIHASIRNADSGPVVVEKTFIAAPISLLTAILVVILIWWISRRRPSSRREAFRHDQTAG